MSEHPLELSARLLDPGVVDTAPNRVTEELSELADRVASSSRSATSSSSTPATVASPPTRATALSAEVVALAGGVDTLVVRAVELSGDGDHRLACRLIDDAIGADPTARSPTRPGSRSIRPVVPSRPR